MRGGAFLGAVAAALLAVLFAFAFKTFKDAGEFRDIQNKGTENCRVVLPTDKDGVGIEKIVLDQDSNFAFATSDNRSWVALYTPKNAPVAKGKIYAINLNNEEEFFPVPLIDYPFSHFHPHGMHFTVSSSGVKRFFIVNHRIDDQGLTLEAVDVFDLTGNGKDQTFTLRYRESITDSLQFTAINDILVLSESSFYITNWYRHRPDNAFLLSKLEVYTQQPWTNVLFCKKTKDAWSCSQVADSLTMANGIAQSPDQKHVYVAASISRQIHMFNRSEDNSLTPWKTVKVPGCPDNLSVRPDGGILIGAHPKALSFVRHSHNHEKLSPSQILVIKKPSDQSADEILVSNGEKFSGSCMAVSNKEKIYVGAVYNKGVYVCQGLLSK